MSLFPVLPKGHWYRGCVPHPRPSILLVVRSTLPRVDLEGTPLGIEAAIPSEDRTMDRSVVTR